jgi:integrase
MSLERHDEPPESLQLDRPCHTYPSSARKLDPGDTRDRALICLGFASGCRRSELVALDVADLSFGDDGLEITIRRSKTDQEGLGRKVGIPFGGRPRTCPVRAVRDWIDFSLLTEGPLFRPVNRFGKILPVAAYGSERGPDRQALGPRGRLRPGAVRRPPCERTLHP